MTKKQVGKDIQTLYLEGKLSDAIRHLETIQAKYGREYTDLWIIKEYARYPGEEDGICVRGSRLETDEEYATRTVRESSAKVLAEEKERKQFEELKKKYG